MLRPVKSAESLSTASINHPQRTQSDRVSCTTAKPGLAATLLNSSNASNGTNLLKIQGSEDNGQSTTKELPKRNTCFREKTDSNKAAPSDPKTPASRPLSSVELDEVGELEQVAQAVSNLKNSIISNSRTSSPKCHSRSSSHDSYFDKKLASSVVQFKDADEDSECANEQFVESPRRTNNHDNASLDLSEIQVNFELEDNEMKIFSEDEAMLSNSCGSDLSKSLAGNSIFDEDFQFGNTKNIKTCSKTQASRAGDDNLISPKNRRMSFREKFRIFTSPNSGRKSEGIEGAETQQCSAVKEDVGKKSSIKDKVFGTLSPESLRKRNNILGKPTTAQQDTPQQIPIDVTVSPMKKKSSSPTLGTSPNNTTLLVKRSKIESSDQHSAIHESPSIPNEDLFTAQSDPTPCGIPLSPSIQFMDESTESTSRFNTNPGKHEFFLSASIDTF